MRTVLIHLVAFGDNQMFSFGAGFGPHTKHEDALEFIFRQCNHVDGTEWIEGKPFRSLSCGDIVILIEEDVVTRYTCRPVGWEVIENTRR